MGGGGGVDCGGRSRLLLEAAGDGVCAVQSFAEQNQQKNKETERKPKRQSKSLTIMKRVGGIRDLPHAASKQSAVGALRTRRHAAAAGGCSEGIAGEGLHHFVHLPPLNRKDKAEHEQKPYQNRRSSAQPHIIEAMLWPFLP